MDNNVTQHVSIRDALTGHVQSALDSLFSQGWLTGEIPQVILSPPKQASHGDFACTVALSLAKSSRKNPREIAVELQKALGDAGGMLSKSEVAGAGFLNFFVTDAAWREGFAQILSRGKSYIRTKVGKGERVLVEYVSANPTGPLHIAHGRGAVTGDVVSRLLDAAGFAVEREYYINDLGNQTDVMARSVFLRYGEMCGRPFTAPEDFYPGEYIVDIARELHTQFGTLYLDAPESEWLEIFRAHGITSMMARIRADLEAFGIRFDHYVSERELTERIGLDDMLRRLHDAGHIYIEEAKQWFRSTAFGDDKDRVVVREDGRPTYFASDIAYHDNKMQRQFKRLINVWGADHGGYVARVKAGLTALGYDAALLDVILIQMVSLVRGGEAVRMGKRLGTAVWLREIIDEAGRDATRYFFLMRRSDAQMEFDVELATKQSLDNPVFYAQMGHARMCAIMRKATAMGIEMPTYSDGALDALTLPEEMSLIKTVVRAPEVVADAALRYEPHQIVHYIQDLIAQFHSYYSQYKNTERVVSNDAQKTRARLLLCEGLRTILETLLQDILGVSAPAQMSLPEESESLAP